VEVGSMSTMLVVAFVTALLMAALLMPLVMRLATRLGAVSRPGGRHVHGRVTPLLGGLAIAAGFFAGIIVAFPSLLADATTRIPDAPLLLGLGGGAIGMVVLGFIDDTRGLRAVKKLGIQAAIAFAVCLCGLQIHSIYVPLIGSVNLGILAIPITVFWIVAVINAVNLIDGLDGLAGGVVFFAALTNLAVALIVGNDFFALVMATLMGATLGFLLFNFNPARIFMGDSGSYFLGFVLAAVSAAGPHHKTSTAVSILVPILALGLPIFDTAFAMVRRFLKRQPIFAPDRGHIHHRLLDLGLTPRRAVSSLYGVSLLFTFIAIVIALGRDWEVGVALIAASIVLVAMVRLVIVPTRCREKADSAESAANRQSMPPRTVTARFRVQPADAQWAPMPARALKMNTPRR
jgi:UDP-GlcNAc:undecaprenyl-phosphate/decaprenyl-phosphate GlcNAc-1-phosphate transferase